MHLSTPPTVMPAKTELPPSNVDGALTKVLRNYDWLVALVCLLSIEFFCFGAIVQNIGFYLDDWTMYNTLHAGPQNLLGLMQHYLLDPKVIHRPLEVPWFSALHLMFGAKPLGYHLVNQAVEVLGAWFAYLALLPLTRSRTLALTAACLFLIYPSHDVTHYSVNSNSIPLSMSLFTLGLWQLVKAVELRSPWWVAASTTSYLLSLYNYELCLPLCVLYGASALFLLWDKTSPLKALLWAALYQAPSALAVLSMVIYRCKILPALHLGWVYSSRFDLFHFLHVIQQGIKVSVSPYAFSYFGNLAQQTVAAGLTNPEMLCLLFITLVPALCLLLLPSEEKHPSTAARMILLGALGLLSSYTIYGMTADYMPVLGTSVDRINTGGSLGAVLLITGCLAFAIDKLALQSRSSKSLVVTCLCTGLLVLFTLTNWGFSRPWTSSWSVQKHIVRLVKQKAPSLHDGDIVLLANAPRFVMWAPVFDGVWDFEAMVHIVTKNPQIKAGVVSERMLVSKQNVKDISAGYLCATYPFKRMFLFVPNPEAWYPINSAQQFVDYVKQYGMQFGLDPKTPQRWQKELAATPDSTN